MNAKTTVKHYLKFLSHGISKITWLPNPQTDLGCLQILIIGGFCLGLILVLIFGLWGWMIWVVTAVWLLLPAFLLAFTALYEKDLMSGGLCGPVAGFLAWLLVIGFFAFFLFLLAI